MHKHGERMEESKQLRHKLLFEKTSQIAIQACVIIYFSMLLPYIMWNMEEMVNGNEWKVDKLLNDAVLFSACV